MKNAGTHIKLSDFPLIAFLIANSQEIVDILPTTEPSRLEFVFERNDDVERLLKIFKFSADDSKELLIDARKLFSAMKRVKDLLQQSKGYNI